MTMTTNEPRDVTTLQARGPSTGPWVVLTAVAILGVVALLWYQGVFSPKPRIALVTAGEGQYWNLIVQGADEAAKRHGVRLDVVRPASDEPSQTAAIRKLIGAGYDGVAISPNDPLRQARTLAEVAARSNLVTLDADSNISRRLCFVGTDNYDAGRMCGTYVREVLPQGGTVLISLSSVEKENGHRRRQGVIDELLERPTEPNRPMDALDAPLKGPKYTILATLVDNYDPAKATELAVDAIKKHPDVGCIVALFARTPPAILKALEQTNKLGQIKVVGFDANEETLEGIKNGHVHASIVQDAYNIGYQAVRILADASHGDPNAIPLFPTFYLRCDEVTKENLEAMREAMASRHKPGRTPSIAAPGSGAATRPTTAPTSDKPAEASPEAAPKEAPTEAPAP